MLVLAESPPRDIELMRSLVARVAVAVVPVPVPVVVEVVPVERLLRRGPEPRVVIDLRQVLRRVRTFRSLPANGERELAVPGLHRSVRGLADRRARPEAPGAGAVEL